MGNSRTHLNFYRLNGIKSRLKKSGRSGWMTRPNQSLPYAIRLEEASKKHLVPLLWGSFPWEWDWAYISKTEDDMEKWALPLIIQAHPIMELYHHPLPTSGWFISHFLSYYFHWFRERKRWAWKLFSQTLASEAVAAANQFLFVFLLLSTLSFPQSPEVISIF